MFKAIIIGGTGATGRQLLNQLMQNQNCELVTSIGRKPVLDGAKNDKLVDIVVESLANLSSTEKSWEGNDVFFNCIGTTRQRAGGAKEFIHIEAGISNEAAKMASNAKIHHASLVSAKGANHTTWAKDWIHPLLYMRTMGQKEQTILSNFSFNHVSIFKPGMLIRLQGKQTWFESFSESKGFGLRVDTLASAMIRNAEQVKLGSVEKSPQFFIGNDDIQSS
ncbi:MAG: NAD(P)H-binding protein [Candidatus Marinimicrobia bacterium]|jgi:nucleoside-diphosphate-sugar epimerase|nr:NAD(P)H-binding protein [Candidatus Neomarinimicrobiota bacterium]MBT5720795.1 NAD(P)H-binding protein [Candidatus Neomarinimicrobiota bacterium]